MNVRDSHRQAMEMADLAFLEKLHGRESSAMGLLHEAFQLERQAAIQVEPSSSNEPTRSVLLRSAASLAMECGETREAERLIAMALVGNPPHEIAEELRDLFEQVNFRRHLETRGITLDPTEFQFSIIGNAVSYGMALADQFFERVESVEKLIYRTVERISGKDFRERGKLEKSITDNFAIFVSVPRERSFAVSFRVGGSEQLFLPGLESSGTASSLIDELLTCLELLNSSDEKALQEKISDPAYYRNFIGLSRTIAPDGDQVKQVGFTAIRNGQERMVALTKPQSQILPAAITFINEPKKIALAENIRMKITGELRHADATNSTEGKIWLVDESGKKHEVIVPAGMMADIVKPLWEDTVEVIGTKAGKKIQLEAIQKADS